MTNLRLRHYELALTLLILGSLALNDYSFGTNDHTATLSWLKSLSDPRLYALDITVAVKGRYLSFFYTLVEPLQRLLGWSHAFFAVYVLSRSLFFLSAYLIGLRLSGEKIVGLLAVMLLFFPRQALGGIATLDTQVNERALGLALSLLGVYHAISGRAIKAGLILALAAAVHAVTAVNLLIFVFFYQLIDAWLNGNAAAKLASRLLAFAAPVCVVILLSILGAGRSGGASLLTWVDPPWLEMIKLRSGHHFFPNYAQFGKLLGLGILTLAALLKQDALKNGPLRLAAIAQMAALLSLVAGFAAGTLAIKVWPLLAAIDLCFFRASLALVILSPISLAALWWRQMPRRHDVAIGVVIGLACLPASFYVLGLDALALGMILASPAPLLSGRLAAGPQGVSPAPGKVIFAAMLSFLLVAGLSSRPRWGGPTPANLDAQNWLRQNTPADALILTPPDEDDFRIFSERSTVGSYKDWTYNDLDRSFAFEMRRRLTDQCGVLSRATCGNFSNCRRTCGNHYRSMSTEAIAAVSRKYGATHVVMACENPQALKLLYTNGRYCVYKI